MNKPLPHYGETYKAAAFDDAGDPVSRAEHNNTIIRSMTFEIALREILEVKAPVQRHFSGPSPEDEQEATVPETYFDCLQEIAAAALSTPPTIGEAT